MRGAILARFTAEFLDLPPLELIHDGRLDGGLGAVDAPTVQNGHEPPILGPLDGVAPGVAAGGLRVVIQVKDLDWPHPCGAAPEYIDNVDRLDVAGLAAV